MSARDIKNSVWLVTGSAAGFGRAICEEVIARGGKMVATARDPGRLADLVALAPDRVLALELDVTSEKKIDSCIKNALERFGQIDVLVNNAGHGFMAAVEEASAREARSLFDVNFFGLVSMTQAVLPTMRKARAGMIVNISSISGVRGTGGASYYCASKFAVEGLSEALAQEVAPFGIGVLIVEPGTFRTDFFGRGMMMPARRMPEYEGATRLRTMSDTMDGKQPGDPRLAAAIIVDTALLSKPPLRLMIGKGIWISARDSLLARVQDMEFSRELSETTDYGADAQA